MKNQKTLGLLLGTTCLATIAMAQVSRPGETPTQERQPATGQNAAGQNNVDSLLKVQQRLQQAVTTELRTGALKHDVTIDDSSVMISLLGDRGIVAGASAKAGSAKGQDTQRKAGDTSTTTETGREQDNARNPNGTATQTGANTNQQVLGVVCFSRAIAPTGAGQTPGSTDRTPGSDASQGRTPGADSGQNAGAGQDAKNRDREAAGQGAIVTDPAGSNELVAFEVRRSQQGQQVELVDESGRVAMQVQLLGAARGGAREASAPREAREDASVGGGDPLADPRNQDPQAKDRARTGNTQQYDMDKAQSASADWNVVYASVVNQLCNEQHGKK